MPVRPALDTAREKWYKKDRRERSGPVKRYENMMEGFVEEVLDIMGDSLGCCMCEQCRNDVAAHALNQLPPRYVVSHMGGAISKADTMRIQHLTDVRTALVQAAQIVKEQPRH